MELGVPTYKAAYIFLAGMRSRTAATELATLDVDFGCSVSEISRNLRTSSFVERLYPMLSAATVSWLELLVNDASQHRPANMPNIAPFTVDNVDGTDRLHARRIDGNIFLCTVDGKTRVPVAPAEESLFNEIANDPRIIFVRNGTNWLMEIRDPRLSFRDDD